VAGLVVHRRDGPMELWVGERREPARPPVGAFGEVEAQGLDEHHVGQHSDTIVVFRVDPSTGKLAPTGETVHTPTPVDIEFGARRFLISLPPIS
jgi:hypothetical protein